MSLFRVLGSFGEDMKVSRMPSCRAKKRSEFHRPQTPPMYISHQLVPQLVVHLETMLLAVLQIHAPETEPIHRLTEGIVVVEEFNGAGNVEDDFGILAHVQGMDCAGHLGDVVAFLADPFIFVIPWKAY